MSCNFLTVCIYNVPILKQQVQLYIFIMNQIFIVTQNMIGFKRLNYYQTWDMYLNEIAITI